VKRALAAPILLVTTGCSLIQSLDGYDAEPPLGGGGKGCSEPTPFCQPLAPPTGAVITVTPSQAPMLGELLAAANPGDTFMLRSGTYSVGALAIVTPSVTLRSESGCRGDVIIDGGYQSPDVLTVAASNVTIAHVTLTRGVSAIVRVRPQTEDITGVRLHDVHLLDPGDRGLRVLPGPALASFADGGTMTCSRIELAAAGRAWIESEGSECFTAGVDAIGARDWVFADNTFAGFWCKAGLGGHALRVSGGSRDTLVERNVVIDSARGIGLGFKECPSTNVGDGCEGNAEESPWRTYADGSCPEPPVGTCCAQAAYGHCGGVVRNNFLSAIGDILASDEKVDTGINLEQALGTEVVHNTVMTGNNEGILFSSIEWRWAGTVAHVANNIVGFNLNERDGATATVEGNLENASAGLFSDAIASGDLHLQPLPQSAAAVDQGVPLARGLAPEDIDGDERDTMPDIGADELR